MHSNKQLKIIVTYDCKQYKRIYTRLPGRPYDITQVCSCSGETMLLKFVHNYLFIPTSYSP